MNLSQLPPSLKYEPPGTPIRVEFDRRIGHYSMGGNHYHSACEIYYLFSGERNYFIRDRSYSVRPGDLVPIGANVVHKTSDAGVPNHERIVVYYEKAFFESLDAEEADLLLTPFNLEYAVRSLNLQERAHVETLLHSLLGELAETPPGYGMHIRHMAAELLLFAARHAREQDSSPPVEPTPVQRKITEIVRHINSGYAEPLDLDGLSKRFYISSSHLSRMFKEETGFKFTEYVNLTRIKEARLLLRDTNLGVTAVSERTGFDNFSHFGKVFKKITGMSPRQYRSMYRSD